MKGKLRTVRQGVVWVAAIPPTLRLSLAILLSATLPSRQRAAA